MNRRNFLQFATLAIAGQAAERVFPFRVYSIPKTICAPKIDLVGLNLDQFSGGEITGLYGLSGDIPSGQLDTCGQFMNISRSPYPGQCWPRAVAEQRMLDHMKLDQEQAWAHISEILGLGHFERIRQQRASTESCP